MVREGEVLRRLEALQRSRALEVMERAKTEDLLAALRGRKSSTYLDRVWRKTKKAGLPAVARQKLKGYRKSGKTLVTPKSPNQKDTVISLGYDRFLAEMPADTWKLLPHVFAAVMSDGNWLPFKYLVMISHIIVTAIAMGGGRIMISVPPRHGKSFFVSQWLPAWFLANWPHLRVLLTTYEANFAATWGRRVRNIVREKGDRMGVWLADDSTASNNWATTMEGGMVTAGVGGPITGKGADLAIVDDPHKNWQEAQSETTRKMIHEWFDSTFYTRLEPNATIVVLHTRWHEDDLIGYLLREKKDDGWFHIRIPALAEDDEDPIGRPVNAALCPQRYDEKALLRIKENLSPMMWAALFQQRPAPMDGTVFLRKDWKFYSVLPKCKFVLQSWDTAAKKKQGSAFTVCQTWGVSDVGAVLIDQWRDRVEYPQLRKRVEVEHMKYRPNVILIEDRDTGQALIQSLQQETMLPVLPIYPDLDKVIRAQAVSPMHASGRVWVPDPVATKKVWVADFIENCATFPNSLYVDEIDSMSQALAYIMTMAIGGRILSGEKRRTSKLLAGYREMMR